MKDTSLQYFDLYMTYENLSVIPHFDLPQDYSFRLFEEGDKNNWIKIEVSSGDISDIETGNQKFDKYYGSHIEELKKRCVFILNKQKEPIGTATAFFIKDKKNNNTLGHLHWVAISKEYQGKGLSKPLVIEAMKIMYNLGHKKAYLHTQTHSWVVCKIYLKLGWKPNFVDYPKSKEGWEVVYKKIQDSLAKG